MMESIFDAGSAQWQDHGILYGPGETANNLFSLHGVHKTEMVAFHDSGHYQGSIVHVHLFSTTNEMEFKINTR